MKWANRVGLPFPGLNDRAENSPWTRCRTAPALSTCSRASKGSGGGGTVPPDERDEESGEESGEAALTR